MFMWVHVGTWYLGEAVLRQVDLPDWLVLTGRYVSVQGAAEGAML